MEAGTVRRGAAAQRPLHSRGWRWLKRNALSIYAGVAVLYMLIPIGVIAALSVSETPRDRLTFAIGNYTTDYWTSAFSIADLNEALVASLQLAALSTLGATALGTLLAMAMVRHQFLGRRWANVLIVIPMATPEVVIGASLLSMFIYFSAPLGFTTLFLAHVMFSLSFVVVVVRSRLIGFDQRIEEAAADLGADAFTTFRTVTLPLLAPGIFAAAMLAFALSIDDFVISNFNAGTTETFPLYVFGVSLRGIPVQVTVLATLLFVVTVAAMLLVTWQQSRAERLASVRPDQEDAGGPAPAPVLPR